MQDGLVLPLLLLVVVGVVIRLAACAAAKAVDSGPDAAVVEPDPALPRLDPEPVLRAANLLLVQHHVCHSAITANAPPLPRLPMLWCRLPWAMHEQSRTEYVNRRKKSSPDAGPGPGLGHMDVVRVGAVLARRCAAWPSARGQSSRIMQSACGQAVAAAAARGDQ